MAHYVIAPHFNQLPAQTWWHSKERGKEGNQWLFFLLFFPQ
jgi:hypothetical protein